MSVITNRLYGQRLKIGSGSTLKNSNSPVKSSDYLYGQLVKIVLPLNSKTVGTFLFVTTLIYK